MPNKRTDIFHASSRAVSLGRRGAPLSLNEAERSVEFTAATEQPVNVWDWEKWDVVPEVLRMDGDGSLARHGLLLAFDPLLLQPAALCGHVGRYSFFRYRQDEALHLSHREAGDVRRCFADIDEELRRAADDRSRTLLPRLVGLLMSYCARCYERQFITREERNRRLLGRFRLWADTWVAAGRMAAGRVPGAAECAAAVGLSEAYFCDLLLFETGRTPAEYFELRRLEAAKRLLGAGGTTPAQVARRLGFRSTDLFSQVFEKYTGQAPAAYVLN